MLRDYFDDKIYQLYYNEVGRHPLLKSDQERELLRRYHTCPTCNKRLPARVKTANCPKCGAVAPLENPNRVHTCTACCAKFDTHATPRICPFCGSIRDEAARDKLIVSNLRFVIKRAKSISTNPEHVKRLVSAGNIGLMLAIDKFNLEKNTRFLTYAEWWVRKEMLDEIHAASLVHIPTHRQKSLRKEQKEGKYLCVHCGVRTDSPDNTKELSKCGRRKYHKFILPLNNDSAVLNEALSIENLTLQTSENIETATIDSNVEEVLQQVLRSMNLSERDRFIITGYFNVPGRDRKTEPKSLHQLSTLTGITPERVRQIKEQTLSSLKKELKKQSVQRFSEIC